MEILEYSRRHSRLRSDDMARDPQRNQIRSGYQLNRLDCSCKLTNFVKIFERIQNNREIIVRDK
jgi:hypothetical protein